MTNKRGTIVGSALGAIHKRRPQCFSRFLTPLPHVRTCPSVGTPLPVDVRVRDKDPPLQCIFLKNHVESRQVS